MTAATISSMISFDEGSSTVSLQIGAQRWPGDSSQPPGKEFVAVILSNFPLRIWIEAEAALDK